MNTPAHLIIGLAAFGKPEARAVTGAALIGALLPDLSLYLLASFHLVILQTDPQVVFGELYFSDAWQSVFRVDNSLILWGVGLALALALRSRWGIALCGAALLHLAFDLLLHHDDGRAHFWPLTNWIFQSPVSYWDSRHYGDIFGPLEIGLSLALCVVLWRRFRGMWMRGLIVVLGLAEAAPSLLFAVLFAGG
ncbi:cobalamin biosynthesis protein CobQ [Thalassorhabdomicrobium marinisediminis]|uniref:Cobalamin biosynthesis protein CobQ n=1 Tax=Thalassorhabdomicrobium marinisediminis TaxID=2170577 RepID=A0A2T7FXG2_9RHOB|nr:cobalamin biosynthesis protein CobQ [Thalassorhabdomicrobium marinisediminis]PVA06818.1 cobalamin biosynthesis protein CobQ [Thalassorhabdomicrobium marinisediminis]